MLNRQENLEVEEIQNKTGVSKYIASRTYLMNHKDKEKAIKHIQENVVELTHSK